VVAPETGRAGPSTGASISEYFVVMWLLSRQVRMLPTTDGQTSAQNHGRVSITCTPCARALCETRACRGGNGNASAAGRAHRDTRSEFAARQSGVSLPGQGVSSIITSRVPLIFSALNTAVQPVAHRASRSWSVPPSIRLPEASSRPPLL
jgi:hypothetical protein